MKRPDTSMTNVYTLSSTNSERRRRGNVVPKRKKTMFLKGLNFLQQIFSSRKS